MNGYFPFVKLVIPPEPCGAVGNGNGNEVRDGVCLPRGKCEILKGSKNGDCAKGFGDCCRCKKHSFAMLQIYLQTIFEDAYGNKPFLTWCIYSLCYN